MLNSMKLRLSWLESHLFRAENPRFEPHLDYKLFISTYQLALIQFAPLFCPLAHGNKPNKVKSIGTL